MTTKDPLQDTDMSQNADESQRTRVDIDQIKEWLANFDPLMPADPEGAQYVNFADIGKNAGVSLRGDDHIQQLLRGVTLNDKSTCQLFSGFSGTGKSTELARLKHHLEAAGYTVFLVDAKKYHDLVHPLTFEDLLLAATAAFGEQTTLLLGKDVFKESIFDRIAHLLQTELNVDLARLSIGPANLQVGVRHAGSFWVELREKLKQSPGSLIRNCHQFVRECVATIRKKDPTTRGVVLIFDELEKIRGTTFNFQEIMESIIHSFSHSPASLFLPDSHVIFSIPPYVLATRSELGGYYSANVLLPAVKVLERGTEIVPHPVGVQAMTELVARRVDVDQVFGERQDLLERLIIYSGGHVRTLIRFMRETLMRASDEGFPPSDDDVDRVLDNFCSQIMVWYGTSRILMEINRTGSIHTLDSDDVTRIASCMDSYIAICYISGEQKYELHPLIRREVSRLALRETEREAA